MRFDALYERILMEMSPFEKENYPKGIVFFLPVEDRPEDMPPLPEAMADARFWHTGVMLDGQVYETFNHGKSSMRDASERVSGPAFDEVVYAAVPVNVSKLAAELDSGTDCATFVGRVLGMSSTIGYEKDPKLYPDDVFDRLKKDGFRFHKGSSGLKQRRQASR